MEEVALTFSADPSDAVFAWDLRSGAVIAKYASVGAATSSSSASSAAATMALTSNTHALLGQHAFIATVPDKPLLMSYLWHQEQPFRKSVVAEKMSCLAASANGQWLIAGAPSGKLYLWLVRPRESSPFSASQAIQHRSLTRSLADQHGRGRVGVGRTLQGRLERGVRSRRCARAERRSGCRHQRVARGAARRDRSRCVGRRWQLDDAAAGGVVQRPLAADHEPVRRHRRPAGSHRELVARSYVQGVGPWNQGARVLDHVPRGHRVCDVRRRRDGALCWQHLG